MKEIFRKYGIVFLSRPIIWCKFQKFKLHVFRKIEFFLGGCFLCRTLYICFSMLRVWSPWLNPPLLERLKFRQWIRDAKTVPIHLKVLPEKTCDGLVLHPFCSAAVQLVQGNWLLVLIPTYRLSWSLCADLAPGWRCFETWLQWPSMRGQDRWQTCQTQKTDSSIGSTSPVESAVQLCSTGRSWRNGWCKIPASKHTRSAVCSVDQKSWKARVATSLY